MSVLHRFTDPSRTFPEDRAAFVNSPADFGKFIAEFTEKWGKTIRSANIKAD